MLIQRLHGLLSCLLFPPANTPFHTIMAPRYHVAARHTRFALAIAPACSVPWRHASQLEEVELKVAA